MLKFLVIYLIFYITSTLAQNSSLSNDGATVDILGHSGKMTFNFDSNSIQITMSGITELDSDGNAVGTSGNPKHSFNSFANQDFTFSEQYSTSISGVNALAINFSCSIFTGESNLNVITYLFLEDGDIEYSGESYQVFKNSFKFSYYINYWPFCTIGGTGNNNCMKSGNQQEGSFLDFAIEIKNNNNGNDDDDAVDVNDGDDDYNDSLVTWKNGNNIVLPGNYITSPGGVSQMSVNYPEVTNQGSKTIVTFRFNRFTGSLIYDPFLNWESSTSSNTVLIVIVAIAIILSLGAASYFTYMKFKHDPSKPTKDIV